MPPDRGNTNCRWCRSEIAKDAPRLDTCSVDFNPFGELISTTPEKFHLNCYSERREHDKWLAAFRWKRGENP